MKNILIYNSGGGLGDSIQLFPLILSIKKYFKNCDLYYLGAHKNHFEASLKEFNIQLKTLDLKIKYFGFRLWHIFLVKSNFYKQNIEKFDLIIDLQSKLRNTLILKQVPHNLLYSPTLNFKFCSIKKNFIKGKHLDNLMLFLNIKIPKIEYNISLINKDLLNLAKTLLPKKNYIGFSLTQGNAYRKKSWSLDNFKLLAKEFIKRGKIPVFFIKDNEKLIQEISYEIPEALFPEKNSYLNSPALVTALASRLDLAVSIDNGIMHMISLARVPMIVLFGPTNSDKFAPKYDSIKILDSKLLYKSKNINLITVKDVLNAI